MARNARRSPQELSRASGQTPADSAPRPSVPQKDATLEAQTFQEPQNLVTKLKEAADLSASSLQGAVDDAGAGADSGICRRTLREAAAGCDGDLVLSAGRAPMHPAIVPL